MTLIPASHLLGGEVYHLSTNCSYLKDAKVPALQVVKSGLRLCQECEALIQRGQG